MRLTGFPDLGRAASFETQGDAGRHYQGGQKTLLLFETGREETHRTSISPETQPEESASRTPPRGK